MGYVWVLVKMHEISVEKAEWKRLFGILRRRREENNKMGLK